MKKSMVLTSALMLTVTMSACNADGNEAMDTRYNNDTRPIGYYSNNTDGEGPLTEMADRDRNRNDLDRAEVNYADDYNGGDLVKRIRDRVKGMNDVNDARVVVNGDTVLVGIDTNARNDQAIRDKVKNTVQQMTDKNVRVTTDEDMFTRIRNVDDDLRGGNGFAEVRSDVNEIMNDLGDEVQRPFGNNR